MPRLSVLTRIGNAAAVLFGGHGDVTQQAETACCSRQTVYDHAAQVQQTLTEAHQPGPSRQQLLQQVQQLREDNGQLWQWLEQALDGQKRKQQQFAVTAAAMGLSLQQTLTLLAVLLPASRLPSRPTLGRWVQQAGQQANRLLQLLDQAAQRLVLCLCLDEIFFHRKPVLMGIEPHSFAWVLGQRTADRSGPTWAKALAAWPCVRDIAADGGTGIELGLQLTAAKRQEQAAKTQREAVPLAARLDNFHIQREGERALRIEWSQAQELWEQAEKMERAKVRYDRSGQDGRHFKQPVVGKAWAKAIAAFHEVQGKEAAWRRAVAALKLFRPDGQLNDRVWATSELQAACALLSGPRWAKVKRMLLDSRALTFLDRMQEELAQVEPCAERRAAFVALWQWRRQACAKPRERTGCQVVEGVLPGLVVRLLGKEWEQKYRRVSQVLRRVVRASSAVECVNSVVRMHQARHRNLSQELLDLKRLYWNCRSFVSGQRKDRCPYEHLGLKLPSYDAWDLLQTAPEELKKQLSSSGVME